MPTWQSPATEFSIANTKLDTSTGWTGSTSLGTRCTAAGQVGLIKHQSQSYGTLGLIVQRHNIVWPPCQLPLMKCGSMQWTCSCLFKKRLHGRVVSEKVAVFFSIWKMNDQDMIRFFKSVLLMIVCWSALKMLYWLTIKGWETTGPYKG